MWQTNRRTCILFTKGAHGVNATNRFPRNCGQINSTKVRHFHMPNNSNKFSFYSPGLISLRTRMVLIVFLVIAECQLMSLPLSAHL